VQKKILTDLPPMPDGITPNLLELKRHRLAQQRARKAIGNSIPGESKAARRLRRRNGG
jgi:hypothetical protein